MGESLQMTTPSKDAEQSSVVQQKSRKPQKQKQIRSPGKAEPLGSIPDTADVRGKKLSRARLAEMMTLIRTEIAAGTHPNDVRVTCMNRFTVSGTVADKYLRIAKQDLIKQTGYYQVQVREVVQSLLMKIAQDKKATNSDRMRAVDKLVDLFDVKISSEDTAAAEEQIYQEQLAKIDAMDLKKLSETKELWRTRGINVENLMADTEPTGVHTLTKKKITKGKQE